jgi:hypothetical protein
MRSSLEAFPPWLRSGFRLRIARDSLNSNKDQWSDLSIILQFLNISSVKLVFIVLVEFHKGFDVLKMFAAVDVGVDFRVFSSAMLFQTGV